MLYEITNPSDAYTIESDDVLTAGVCVLLLGEGAYGMKDEAGATAMPIFLFGGHEAWLKPLGVDKLDPWVMSHAVELAICFDTVMIGSFADRARMNRVLSVIGDAGERARARDAWHGQRRSSMNDIGRRATAWARRLRELAAPGLAPSKEEAR